MTDVQRLLSTLKQKNPSLADELHRLPDLNRKTGTSPLAGILSLTRTYAQRTEAFENLFAAVFHTGRLESRKYCVPLQAIYWLAEENRLDAFFGQTAGGDPLDPGPQPPAVPRPMLERLLDWAWFEDPLIFTRADLRRIVQGIRSPDLISDYRRFVARRTPRCLQKYILEDFQDTPEVFAPGDTRLIGQTLKRSRWQDFHAVRERLNSPELLHYYLSRRLTYVRTPARGSYRTFRTGRGQCTDAAYLSRDMLSRAGYRTFVRSVKWSADPWAGLHTGAGIIDAKGRYLLVADFNGVNRFSGPYSRIDQVDRCLARNNRIIDRCWGAYYPPSPAGSPCRAGGHGKGTEGRAARRDEA